MCILLGQVFIFGHLSVFGYLVICIFERYFVYLSVYSLGGFVVLENVLEDNELGRFLIKVNTRARRLTFRTREDAIYVTIPPGTTDKECDRRTASPFAGGPEKTYSSSDRLKFSD